MGENSHPPPQQQKGHISNYDAHDRMIKDIFEVGDKGTVAVIKLRALNDKVQSYIQNQQTTALAERGQRQLDSFN